MAASPPARTALLPALMLVACESVIGLGPEPTPPEGASSTGAGGASASSSSGSSSSGSSASAATTSGVTTSSATVGGAGGEAGAGGSGGDPTTTGSGGGVLRSYVEEVLEDRPRVWLRLGETRGTIAVDEMGLADGVYEGDVTLDVDGAIGDGDRAVELDGGCVVLDESLVPAWSAPFTVEAWVRWRGKSAGTFQRILTEETGEKSPDRYGLVIFVDGSARAVASWFTSGGGLVSAYAAVPLTEDVFGHVVVTHDGDDLRVYLDGEEGAAQAVSIDAPVIPGPVRVGCGAGGERPLRGGLDKVALYDVDLPAARVAAHHEAGRQARRAITPRRTQ